MFSSAHDIAERAAEGASLRLSAEVEAGEQELAARLDMLCATLRAEAAAAALAAATQRRHDAEEKVRAIWHALGDGEVA